MRLFYSIVFLFISLAGFSQKEGNIWYFGGGAGLDFNYDPPKVLLDGLVNHLEGNGSIASEDGILKYYGDGQTIWNSKHKVIQNGSGMWGGLSSTQASIFLDHRKNSMYTYNFTTSMKGDSSPFVLYIIKNDSVIIKNEILQKYGSEKLNAVNHQNNNDIWIGTHSLINDTFFFYLLKRDGILECPKVIIQKPLLSDIGENQGQIKFSTDGKLLSCNFIGIKKQTYIGKFNSEIGTLSNCFILDDLVSYASEFSPNSRYLYVAEFFSSLYQYDLQKFNLADVKNSRKSVISRNQKGSFGLQIAHDKKIYIANPNGKYLSAITKPDSIGEACKYKDSFIYLGGKKCSFGLPNFNQSYFYTPSVDFAYEQNCQTNTLVFEGKDTFKATSYTWLFRKGSVLDSRSGQNLNYSFKDTGKWQVSFIAGNSTRKDTITKIITIRQKLPKGFLGEDLNYCQFDPLPLTLHAPKDLHCIHWYNNAMNELSRIDSVVLIKEGTYYAKATNLSFCVEWDTIKIEKGSPIAGFKVNDICANDSAVFVNTSKYVGSYKWKFGDNETDSKKNPRHKYQTETTTTFNVTLIITLDGCSDSINMPITVNSVPASDFNYTLSGKEISLEADQTGLQKYFWKLGLTDSVLTSVPTYTHIFKSPGQHKVCLKTTNLAGCFSETCKTVTLGITSVEKVLGITIYPNPNKGKLYIDIVKPGNYALKVFNPTGQLVLEKALEGSYTNVVLLNQQIGNYMIEIRTESGEVFTKKMLLE